MSGTFALTETRLRVLRLLAAAPRGLDAHALGLRMTRVEPEHIDWPALALRSGASTHALVRAGFVEREFVVYRFYRAGKPRSKRVLRAYMITPEGRAALAETSAREAA